MKHIILILSVLAVLAIGFVLSKTYIQNPTVSSEASSNIVVRDNQENTNTINALGAGSIESAMLNGPSNSSEKLNSEELVAGDTQKSIDEKQVIFKNKIQNLDNDLLNKAKKNNLQKELADADEYRENILKKAKEEMQKPVKVINPTP